MKKKILYYGRAVLALVIGVMSVLAFAGVFYPVRIFDVQFTALLQRVAVDFSVAAVILLGLLLVLTLLFGRFYCSTLCPFGLLQELFMTVFRRKTGGQKNLPFKYFLAVVMFGFLAGGTVLAARWLDPYTLFGSAASGAWIGLTAVVLVLILVWFKGHFFCVNICPVGVVLGLLSKIALNKIYIENDKCVSCGLCARKCPTGSIDFKNKTVDNETCIKCFKCLNQCHKDSLHYGIKPAKIVPFSPARRRLLVSTAFAAFVAATIRGGMDFARAAVGKLKKAVLPAGAGNADDFANRCLNCNLCVQNCPMKIIKKANEDYLTVHIDYGDNFCDYNCHKCSEVCPSGAIKKITLEQKQKTQIALAMVDEDTCVKCGLCVRECPRQIIRKADGAYPQISTDECIGCGACQSVCPVKAITMLPVEKQKILG